MDQKIDESLKQVEIDYQKAKYDLDLDMLKQTNALEIEGMTNYGKLTYERMQFDANMENEQKTHDFKQACDLHNRIDSLRRFLESEVAVKLGNKDELCMEFFEFRRLYECWCAHQQDTTIMLEIEDVRVQNILKEYNVVVGIDDNQLLFGAGAIPTNDMPKYLRRKSRGLFRSCC